MAWVLPRLVWHLEDLRVGMSWQNYYIAHLASKFVKVVLAGGGGDELFGGYPWRYSRVVGCKTDDEFEDAYFDYWQRLVRVDERADAFTPGILQAIGEWDPRERMREILGSCRPQATSETRAEYNANRAMYFEAKTFLHGLFIVEDKISMAHGMETRVPFLDNDLVDYACRIPVGLKLSGLSSDDFGKPGAATSEGKAILRNAMSGLIPEQVLHNEKHGFSPPDGTWYRGPTMEYIREVLLEEKALGRGIFRPEYVRRVIDEHTAGAVNHRLLIWSMLSLEWWQRVFLDDESPVGRFDALGFSIPSEVALSA
jgi:asparagine synthase (glutamine-hydrolysing)